MDLPNAASGQPEQVADAQTELNDNMLPILVAAAVVVATVVFLFSRSSSGGSSDLASIAAPTQQKVEGVTLIGCSGSGKTAILHQISSGTVPATVPSMVPAYHTVKIPGGKRVQVVDVPGHERLRVSLLQHVKSARGVVLVVDPSGIKAIKAAAGLLFELLKSDELGAATPLLVFSNKSDLKEAKSSDRVKGLFQKEVESMRKTAGTMGVADGNKAAVLGDEHFNLDARGVLFASGSALGGGGKADLSALVAFIGSCC